MTDSNKKGSRRERELRNYYRARDGYAPLRMAASGSGIDMDLPDLLVGRPDRKPLAIEAKSGAEDTILYVTAEEADALIRFAGLFGAVPRVSGRWDQDTSHYLASPYDVPRTDAGSLRMRPETAKEEWEEVTQPAD